MCGVAMATDYPPPPPHSIVMEVDPSVLLNRIAVKVSHAMANVLIIIIIG